MASNRPIPTVPRRLAVVQTIESIKREHPGESIAILVRNRTHLRHVLHVLSARRIPWTGSDIHALADQPVIVDLMTLLKALSSSTDRIAWLALLRTPFVGRIAARHRVAGAVQRNDCGIGTFRRAR